MHNWQEKKKENLTENEQMVFSAIGSKPTTHFLETIF